VATAAAVIQRVCPSMGGYSCDGYSKSMSLNGRLQLRRLFKEYVLIGINFQSVMHIYYKEAKLASLKQDIPPWQPYKLVLEFKL